MLPADYVAEQVLLTYASTVYGAQGQTVTAAHVVIGDLTSAAPASVGMPRAAEWQHRSPRRRLP